ncbi:hypothetical protein [Cronobacter dublinensis]|nr:hypothetical protein [Cronobacter dublinensis]
MTAFWLNANVHVVPGFSLLVKLYEQRGDTGTVTDIKSKINALG